MAPGQRWKRIWPTLLSASAQAAIRASESQTKPSADIHAAIILARTAFDAYLHELIILRRIPPYIQYATSPGAKTMLSSIAWKLITASRPSLAGISTGEKKGYHDIRDLQLDLKLQAILLLLNVPHSSPLVGTFEVIFGPVRRLNTLRNAIVHHDFGPPSSALVGVCKIICANLKITPPAKNRPWEEILDYPALAKWACSTVCASLLILEAIEQNRTIHLSSTRDTIASAISPLALE